MENIFNINRESNFKNGVVDSVPVGNNNIVINRKSDNDFRREDINSHKPKLSGNKVFWSWNTFSTALFWGIGLMAHGLSVFSRNMFFGSQWEERKIREFMEKEKTEKWE